MGVSPVLAVSSVSFLIREYSSCCVLSHAQDYPSAREPLREFHGKAIEYRFPIPDRHSPLLGQVAHGQVDHFVDGLIGGKNPMIARHLAQGHIDRLNGIGGVDHLADVLWKGEERDH